MGLRTSEPLESQARVDLGEDILAVKIENVDVETCFMTVWKVLCTKLYGDSLNIESAFSMQACSLTLLKLAGSLDARLDTLHKLTWPIKQKL